MDRLIAQQLADRRRSIAQAIVEIVDPVLTGQSRLMQIGGPWALVELTESVISDTGSQITNIMLYNRGNNSHVHIAVEVCAEGETCPTLFG